MRTIVWFRGKDMRLSDHTPLATGIRTGEVIPLFVLDPYYFAPQRAKRIPHRIQFLLDSLVSLERNLEALGSKLVVVLGRSTDVIPELVKKWGADRVVAQGWAAPVGRKRDHAISQVLGNRFQLFEGETLVPPGTIRSGSGNPYASFTPFASSWQRYYSSTDVIPVPTSLPALPKDISIPNARIPTCEDLGITRNKSLLSGGEKLAQDRLRLFLNGPATEYDVDRDRMDIPATSHLSADLKFGTSSIRQVYKAAAEKLKGSEAGVSFLSELVWREFAYSTIQDFPEVLDGPYRREFDDFPWLDDKSGFDAWVSGNTGYPIVDAASRQLMAQGYLPNRARMIAASFLTKHLVINYRRGEAHYMKWLVDGDWAQNNMGWQWTAGCGCSAQPYFRMFNPITQGKKFDPYGAYVRKWIPELERLPNRYIHCPWETPVGLQDELGLKIGKDYPAPIVDHSNARKRYLGRASQHLKNSV
ncbi:MAG: cryptochrome/photolyase family protein [Planctomycetota bacterium]|jgi:deoxyribodipyrimidine photo-lyase